MPHTSQTRHAVAVSAAEPCVLVVEDDPTIRDLYSALLSDEGYRVETAIDGKDGLAHLTCSPDIILLDLLMPLMDGREFLRRLRKRAAQKLTPVLVISAIYDGSGIPAGAQAVMRKPFDALLLLEQMSRMLAPAAR
jgi:CheY-like chemotaxis protein